MAATFTAERSAYTLVVLGASCQPVIPVLSAANRATSIIGLFTDINEIFCVCRVFVKNVKICYLFHLLQSSYMTCSVIYCGMQGVSQSIYFFFFVISSSSQKSKDSNFRTIRPFFGMDINLLKTKRRLLYLTFWRRIFFFSNFSTSCI